jgi:hypothetical protein
MMTREPHVVCGPRLEGMTPGSKSKPLAGEEQEEVSIASRATSGVKGVDLAI